MMVSCEMPQIVGKQYTDIPYSKSNKCSLKSWGVDSIFGFTGILMPSITHSGLSIRPATTTNPRPWKEKEEKERAIITTTNLPGKWPG